MLFNSFDFAVFLAVVLGLYYSLGRRSQNAMLVVASYVFYGWWDWRFLSLLLISTLVDYSCALSIDSSTEAARRRRFLLLSLCSNLGILGFFKYHGFFVESTVAALDALGIQASIPVLSVILPVGISFYTFQTLSYTIDVYRGATKPTNDLVTFALYVAFFPQLVAGPIERSYRFLPQLEQSRRVDAQAIGTGCQLILLGLFKKVFIADGVAPLVDASFSKPLDFSSARLFLTLYLFSLQIYGDFSGYTDIARGVARLLGIDLARNFRQPYLSRDVSEFWRRWHISLSTWLRDYLYIPLGGNRGGTAGTYRNLMLTMLLGGLWHGASWTFVLWGGLHGLYLVLHRLWRAMLDRARNTTVSTGSTALRSAISILFTFHLVSFTWLFFRAESLDAALLYIGRLLELDGSVAPRFAGIVAFYLAVTLAVDLPGWRRDLETPFEALDAAWLRGLVYALMLGAISFVGSSNVRPFIYFQF